MTPTVRILAPSIRESPPGTVRIPVALTHLKTQPVVTWEATTAEALRLARDILNVFQQQLQETGPVTEAAS